MTTDIFTLTIYSVHYLLIDVCRTVEVISVPLRQDQFVKYEQRSELRVALLKGRVRPNSLSFSLSRNGVGTYPDTGESGEAYDAEAFLDA